LADSASPTATQFNEVGQLMLASSDTPEGTLSLAHEVPPSFEASITGPAASSPTTQQSGPLQETLSSSVSDDRSGT
jgi:hypothetical protein